MHVNITIKTNVVCYMMYYISETNLLKHWATAVNNYSFNRIQVIGCFDLTFPFDFLPNISKESGMNFNINSIDLTNGTL